MKIEMVNGPPRVIANANVFGARGCVARVVGCVVHAIGRFRRGIIVRYAGCEQQTSSDKQRPAKQGSQVDCCAKVFTHVRKTSINKVNER